ncbi:MAG: class I SAM-dependent methyltransferase [Nanoarchaeota archaeon]|nr:class I SAM-dependent methyltransferase [Nanoarchaeota archaeon]
MDFYRLISKGYNELYGEEQKVKLNIIKENLDIKSTDLLLDVGCGTGISDFDCKVLGIDPSVELLKQNLGNQTVLAKAENIPFKDRSFDKVISVTAMHNFDNIEKSMEEIRRVGKKDFAFSILKKSSKFDFIEKEIKENFNIKKIIDGKKDWVFICSKIFK